MIASEKKNDVIMKINWSIMRPITRHQAIITKTTQAPPILISFLFFLEEDAVLNIIKNLRIMMLDFFDM